MIGGLHSTLGVLLFGVGEFGVEFLGSIFGVGG